MTTNLLLGIDLGTSGVKAGVYIENGKLLGLGRSSEYSFYSPKPGWSQSDPELWWRDIVVSIKRACSDAGIKSHRISSIGTSVFFPSIIPIGADGISLYPAILYNDQRSTQQVKNILGKMSRREYEEKIGNVLMPGTCAVTSIAWLRDNEPEKYELSKVLGFANTYVTSRLTGEYYTDPSMVTQSGMGDIHNPYKWSEALCSILSIDINRMPQIASSAEVIGGVSKAASEATGIKKGTPVVCGCGDTVASTFGAGALTGETIVYIAGSSDCVTVPLAEPSQDHRWVNTAYIKKNLWLSIGTSTSTGASLDWFTREFFGTDARKSKTKRDIYATVTKLASSSGPGSNGVIFLPYLQGERTPIWDPHARGMFAGLSASTTRCDLARAVFEGTAFAFRDVIECLEEIKASSVKEIRAVGGGIQNDFWNQIKADILQKQLDVLEFQETGSLGAALLAGMGTNVYSSFEEAGNVGRAITGTKRVVPDPVNKTLYDELFLLYRDLYPQMKEIIHLMVDKTETENV